MPDDGQGERIEKFNQSFPADLRRAGRTGMAFSLKRSESTPEHKKALFFESLGLYGLEEVEYIFLSAVCQQSPVLLIGPPGTAKTLFVERLAKVLKVNMKHYNASQVMLDDIIGYPVRDGEKILYLPTPASCWDAEMIFIDEISRCKPETQNKLFSIIYEKKVMGMPLEKLVYRWAAMNPPFLTTEVNSPLSFLCEGSFPLDAALADRFNFIMAFPSIDRLPSPVQKKIIKCGNRDEVIDYERISHELKQLREHVNRFVGLVREAYEDSIVEFIHILIEELAKHNMHISGRRAVMLRENIIYTACVMHFFEEVDIMECIHLVSMNSMPHRAYMEVDEEKLRAIISRALMLSRIKDDVKRIISMEKHPIRRVFIALSSNGKVRDDLLNILILDALYSNLPPWEKFAFVISGYEVFRSLPLRAEVADEISRIYMEFVTPGEVKTWCSVVGDIEKFVGSLKEEREIKKILYDLFLTLGLRDFNCEKAYAAFKEYRKEFQKICRMRKKEV